MGGDFIYISVIVYRVGSVLLMVIDVIGPVLTISIRKKYKLMHIVSPYQIRGRLCTRCAVPDKAAAH